MKPILLFLLLLCSPVFAASFTLESAVKHALAHNPDLAAARFRIDEAKGRLTGAGRHMNPELEVGFNKMTSGQEGAVSITFMQKFPVTGRLHLEKAVSQAELAVAEAEFRNEQRKLSAEVRTAMVKLLVLEDKRGLAKRQLANGQEMSKLATGRASAGSGSVTEASQFELEAQELELQLLMLDAEKPMLTGELRVLLGMSPSETLTVSGGLPEMDKSAHLNTDPEMRADLHSAASMVEAAQRSVELERAKKYEDISFGAMVEGAKRMDAPEPIRNETTLGLKITIPLPFWNRNEGRIQEAAAAAQRAEKEREAMALRIRSEIAAAHAEMKAQAAVVTATTQTLLPKAAEIEQRLLAQFRQGQSSIQDMLRARDKRLQLERARFDALRDYHLARAKWLSATGH